jgi:tetratricopeptide (TPR) repeat protein
VSGPESIPSAGYWLAATSVPLQPTSDCGEVERMQRCKLLKLLPITILLLAASCTRDPKVQAQHDLEQGNKFFAKGRYKEATLMYRRGLQKDGRFGEVYYRLALTEIKLGNYGDAIKGLRRAVELQPTNTDAITKLADFLLQGAMQVSSQRTFLIGEVKDLSDKLIGLNPDSFDGHRLRGQVALLNKDAPGAIAEFSKANKVNPNQANLVLVYFTALVYNNQFPEAEKLAQEFIDKNKSDSRMYDLLYVQYARKNDVQAAETLLKQKLANNPTQSKYVVQLAGHYFFTAKKPEMEATIQQLSDEKKFPDGRLTAGDFYYFRLRDFENARIQYEAGIKAFPAEKAIYQKRLVELYAATGKNQQANEVLAAVLKDNSKDNDAIAMRAALMLTTGNRDQINQAATDLQSLVTKTPQNHLYHYNLARALLAKGDIDGARLQLEEAIKIRSDFTAARVMLARLYMAKSDPAKALKEAEGVIALDRNNLQAHLMRSNALLIMGDKDKARDELAAITRAAPQNREARYQLGYLAFQDKDYKKSEQIYSDLFKANPKDVRGLAGEAESLAAQNRIGDAIKETQQAIEKDPQREDLKLVLAKFYVRSERYDEAIALYQKLLVQDPRSRDLLWQMGETQRRKGDLNTAIETFRRCSQSAPSDTACLTQLGMIYEGTGKSDQAKPIWEQVLKIQPDHGLALNNLAFAKAQDGVDLDQALTMSQKARQQMPNSPAVSDTLGWIYVKKNLSDDAVRIFKDLTAQVPDSPTFHYHYGVALLQKGDKPSAKKEFEKALADKPSTGEEAKIKELLQKI